ncbi:MAG TPA: family 1 glycosylhydrolase [Phenylobacterium sp.]|uniref:family 1 glycosylhydrolase n=1 Tax=Phenylobacterium sp. TaxID=1871053 RepID=UPI002CAF7DBC|nr:family 1 glycosylhydrolase [Phenylobacterium sp.]HSV04158.1 family 1 glycosylhydrolase [Phenylobacterium sp.]
MIRVISVRKAIVAGCAGALAWELLLRALALAGVPLVDIVGSLGLLVLPGGRGWAVWGAGLFLHLIVGVLWAVFYAYFFFSVTLLRPVWQGLVFSALPAALAILIVYPQLKLMGEPAAVAHANAWTLLVAVSWKERIGLLLGHAAYGLALGALYVRPVGRPSDRAFRPPKPARARTKVHATERPPFAFIFASGIECSYPRLLGGRWRLDQMEVTRHYRRWPEDLALAARLGLSHLRYGPAIHLTYPARGRFDWSSADGPMERMRDLGLTTMADLCHFGLPNWLGDFQNPEVPEALAAYAAAFAERYPWVRYYTPVNEMYVCARLSALDGVWNGQRRDERSFVTASAHLAKATVLMMREILARRPDAVFVTSESSEFYQACCPDPEIRRIADLENERRFLPIDLAYGHPVSEPVRQRLVDNGLKADDYAWFMAQELPRRTILGVDYYDWNEKLIDTERHAQALGELFGWYVIASQYYERYRRPMMHTETNHMDAREAPRWLWRQWHNVQLIQKAGVPVVGFTWYSLNDQVDWDIAVSEPLGNVNPVGLFDLNRDPRAVAQAYRHLIRIFGDTPEVRECPTLKALLS